FHRFVVRPVPMSNAIVIIPTYNERDNIVAIVDAVFSQPKDFDILVIDDGSPDGTGALVKKMQADYNTAEHTRLHLIERKGKMGLATGNLMGFQYATDGGYGYILEMDADFSHAPKDLPALYLQCAEFGYDVAIGSRYAPGVNVVNWPNGRVLLSYFTSPYVR